MTESILSSAAFQTSSLCTNGAGGCVEVAALVDGQVAVRDSKDRSKPVHLFTAAEWRDFVIGVKNGEFDFF